MLPALVHPADFLDLAARIRRSGVRILGRPFRGTSQRTRAAWNHTSSIPRLWTEIPLIRERIRSKITGNPQEDLPEYVVRFYGGPEKLWRGLSLGCGIGRRELKWIETGGFASLDGIDLSPARVADAQHRAHQAGVSDRLHFSVADVRSFQVVGEAYDIILIEDALHHFSPMERILSKIRRWLKVDGILVINEYVGPSRFQWTRAQRELVNALLDEFPEHLRIRPDGTRKPRVHRPGTMTMRLYDPSEAVQSSQILPAVRSLFNVQEERPYGGTLLHLLLKDLAHHFLDLDDERRALLQHCCDQEDRAMMEGIIGSDFNVVVAQTTKEG